jgi:hypothetical protein
MRLQRILMKPVPLLDVSGSEFTPAITILNLTDPATPIYSSAGSKTCGKVSVIAPKPLPSYYATDGVIEILIGRDVEGDILIRIFHVQNMLVTTKQVLAFRLTTAP